MSYGDILISIISLWWFWLKIARWRWFSTWKERSVFLISNTIFFNIRVKVAISMENLAMNFELYNINLIWIGIYIIWTIRFHMVVTSALCRQNCATREEFVDLLQYACGKNWKNHYWKKSLCKCSTSNFHSRVSAF